MEPRGCNRWQPAANRIGADVAKQAKTFALGCESGRGSGSRRQTARLGDEEAQRCEQARGGDPGEALDRRQRQRRQCEADARAPLGQGRYASSRPSSARRVASARVTEPHAKGAGNPAVRPMDTSGAVGLAGLAVDLADALDQPGV